MRTIKFRAWSGDKMFHSFTMFNGTVWDTIQDKPIDWPIMQFTGLKDNNGKEIYEGDICRILYSDWPSNSNPEISLEDYLISIASVGQIEYHAPSFYIMLVDRYGDRYPNDLNHGKHGFIEVIGNIHEHPNLL